MIRLPPRSTRTDTLFPYTTLFRSRLCPAKNQEKLLRIRKGQMIPRPGLVRAVRRTRGMAPGGLSAGPAEAPGFARLEARHRIHLFRQPLDDREIGSVVTVAMIGKRLKRPHHGFDLGHFLLESVDMRWEERRVGKGCVSMCRCGWLGFF